MSSPLHSNTEELFHFDPALEDTGELAAALDFEQQDESRDDDEAELLEQSGTLRGKQDVEDSQASEQASRSVQSQDHPTQATISVVIGEDNFFQSFELGVLNERPEALKDIILTPSLPLSAFLKPALQAAMAELLPSLMEQTAVQLTLHSFRLVFRMLSTEDHPPMSVYSAEFQKFAEFVGRELDRSLPHRKWHGERNLFARTQYLMAYVEEELQRLGIQTVSLVQGLKARAETNSAVQNVAHAIEKLGCSSADVCGEWAATLLAAWPLDTARPNTQSWGPSSLHSVRSPGSRRRLKENRSRQSTASEEDSDDSELPSPSQFFAKKPGKRRLEASAQLGDSADDAVYISDSDDGNKYDARKRCLPKSDGQAVRSSRRSEARKVVDYNTKHHPQDDYIPCAPKRRKPLQGL